MASPLPGNESTGYILLHFRDLGSPAVGRVATVADVETSFDLAAALCGLGGVTLTDLFQ
ncbi:hypothetical protein GCM10009557_15960 [Virgisporangium ochraceum]|uniref:Uncharacterized protein n=1 Tax=Virgisporangium ochraceum TaxID=65505 RepID=A0A8J3ZLY0_9ACTN|nr:hypothetical protein Voc01_003090 [Virgisporangium ochraceum]